MRKLKTEGIALMNSAAVRMPMIALLALIVAVMLSGAGSALARKAPDSFADLAEKLSPAVVNISTKQVVKSPHLNEMPQFPPGSPFEDLFRDFFDQQQGQQRSRRVTSLGSGFIIDAEGIIVTNNHVIAQADEITVNLSDGSQLPAELVGRDPKTDLAVLKVESDKPLPFVSFGRSDKIRVGDWVLAIGNPFGLGGSVSAGIISAENRNINSGPYDSFLQTDAAINRGNSGGPLFNLDGEVVGVNTAIISPSGGSIGIGFAIPSNITENVVTQLREFGETRRGWLGVRIQSVTDELAESFGLDKARGALVAEVTDGGPAEQAGIRVGDVILSFNDTDVPEMRDLPRIVAETQVGKKVQVVVWRDGRKKDFDVTLGRLEDFERAEGVAAAQPDKQGSEIADLGLTLIPLNDIVREQFGIPENVEGVAVIDVESASAAAEKGIRPGDVIVEVAQQEVSSPADVSKKVAEIRKSDKKSVLLLLNRGGDLRFVAVRLADE
ncbi:MAG TPA: serine protease [Alphaproteobacteria bacterium]|nr:serine protease [Alphaproteobacteria bacterium]HBC53073.1 serine protease [Alphaproteobacteria bacterium]